MGCVMSILRTLEEILPFMPFLARASRLHRRSESDDILERPEFAVYGSLPEDQLKGRLREERDRAQLLDEKTFRLTLSLSIGLTVVGSTAVPLVRALSGPGIQLIVGACIGLGLFYVLAAGFVALGALRTLRSYGYGTRFLLDLSELPQQDNRQTYLAAELARQETMNLIRHLRNETGYQSLRNGLYLLFPGIIVSFAAFVIRFVYPTTIM